MATIRKVKLPNGDTHDIGVRESEIGWGDKDFTSGYSLGDVFINDALRANRFAGLRAEGILIEHSHDNGATWSEYETTDIQKRNLFTSHSAFLISGSSSVTATVSDQLRITIDTGLGGIYSYLNKFHIYVSTNGSSGCKVSIDAAPSNDLNNYNTVLATNVSIAGWSGWNVIHIPFSFCTAYTGQSTSSNFRKIRFTFKHSGMNTAYKGLQVHRIFAFGGVGYSTPSQMALNGHAYTFDGDMNVTFPAKVTATGDFSGNLTGTASSANNAEKLRGFSSRSDNLTWGNQTGTTIIRMDDDGGGSMGFRKNNPAAGQMSMVIDGTVYVKEGIKRVLDESDLSTSTSSTSTTTAATSSAVKTAYDLANQANSTANTALSGVNGNLIYDHTFTISNGVATFTPHVYQKGEEVTSNYAASCFPWKYRLIDGSEVSLTTKSDRGCDVTISNLGYGGHVIGAFTPPA